MKRKFAVITLLLITLVQLKSSAQYHKNRMAPSLPLIAEDGINSLTVADNVSVILIQDSPENIGVSVPGSLVSKLSVSLVNGDLFLGTTKALAANERLIVYVRVNDLKKLTLKGNSVVISSGILETNTLYISAAKEARVSLKSKGKIWFEAPTNYPVVAGKGYFFVNGIDGYL